jgi:hypothetical protein
MCGFVVSGHINDQSREIIVEDLVLEADINPDINSIVEKCLESGVSPRECVNRNNGGGEIGNKSKKI